MNNMKSHKKKLSPEQREELLSALKAWESRVEKCMKQILNGKGLNDE